MIHAGLDGVWNTFILADWGLGRVHGGLLKAGSLLSDDSEDDVSFDQTLTPRSRNRSTA